MDRAVRSVAERRERTLCGVDVYECAVRETMRVSGIMLREIR